jgi:DNA-binding beta-propeller fold protein YncE
MDSTSGFAIVSCNPGRDDWNTVMVGSPPPELTRSALVKCPQGNYVDSSGHGSLYLYRYADAADKPPALIPLEGFDAPFHPLGVTYHRESQTLAVANHGGAQASVEIFTLEPNAPRALFRQSISDPYSLPTPNSLIFLNATHLYVSNSHQIATFSKPSTLIARLRVSLAWLEHRLGLPTGSVSLIDLTTTKVTKVLHQGFANGVDLLDDGRTLAVAGTSKAAVYFYSIESDPLRPSYTRRVTLPFLPDNLSVDAQGRLLIAGHPHAATLYKMARTNGRCYTGTDKSADCVRAPSWIMEWDPSTGRDGTLRNLFVGSSFSSSATAVRDVKRNVVLVSGLYENGLLLARQ